MNSSSSYLFENVFISSSEGKDRFSGINFLVDSILKQSKTKIIPWHCFDSDLHITLETQANLKNKQLGQYQIKKKTFAQWEKIIMEINDNQRD